MARLRQTPAQTPARPANPLNPPVLLPMPTPDASRSPMTEKTKTARPRSRSTRKMQETSIFEDEPPARRGLRYTSSYDSEAENGNENSSFLVPKISTRGWGGTDVQTPRRQRVLKPVASNSRLLRRLSDESLVSLTPAQERRERKERLEHKDGGRGLSYSRGLARTVAKNKAATPVSSRRTPKRIDVVKPEEVGIDSILERTRLEEPEEKHSEDMEKNAVLDHASGLEEVVEESSIICGEDADFKAQIRVELEQEATQQSIKERRQKDESSDDIMDEHTGEGSDDYQDRNVAEAEDEDEDEESIINPRYRRHVSTQSKHTVQPEEDDYTTEEDEEEDDIVRIASQRQESHVHVTEVHPTAEPTEVELRDLKPMELPLQKGHGTMSTWAQGVVDLTDSPEPPASFMMPPPTRTEPFSNTGRPMSSDSNDASAILRFSPPPVKQRSPRKAPPIERPVTPPLRPPSPTKLMSPSKKKATIPQVPNLRPSLDAFWCPEVVNTWNETHSPAKKLVSPRKQKWLKEIQETIDLSDSDCSSASLLNSPRKSAPPSRSPAKKASSQSSTPTVAQVRAARKAFTESKHAIAQSFLAEVDNTITGGRIASLSEPTGGIKLIWSKTLKTTAGRANWRREQIRTRTGPTADDIQTTYRHHCSIELAEKVIDDEERLYNVLAHEYCHLTTFMISEVRNNPHGAEFKSWAAQVSTAFADRGVEVTTKHSYQISYKYVWECINCGYEFRRHSKSVDPQKHSCGRCKGRLVQTKPTPRGAAKGPEGGKKEKSEYQLFVKENYAKVKERLAAEGKETKLGTVMAAVAEEYRAAKKEKAEKGVVEVEELFGGLKIEDKNT